MTRILLVKKLFSLLDVLYVPTCFILIPSGLCQYDFCAFTTPQILLSVVSFIIVGIYSLGYPVYLIKEIYSQIATNDAEEHETLIKSKEIEYLLGISHSWLIEKCYLFSSYRLTILRVYNKPVYFIAVLLFVVIHGVFYSVYHIKMLVITVVMSFYALYVTLFPVYRCYSSTVLQICSFWTISCNMFFGCLKA